MNSREKTISCESRNPVETGKVSLLGFFVLLTFVFGGCENEKKVNT